MNIFFKTNNFMLHSIIEKKKIDELTDKWDKIHEGMFEIGNQTADTWWVTL